MKESLRSLKSSNKEELKAVKGGAVTQPAKAKKATKVKAAKKPAKKIAVAKKAIKKPVKKTAVKKAPRTKAKTAIASTTEA